VRKFNLHKHRSFLGGQNMKVFIVFLGIFIISVSAVVFQGDLGAYGHELLLLKEAAEEGAAGAALCLNEEEYAKGNLVFDYKEGEKYIEDYLAYIKRNSKALSEGENYYNIIFQDDKLGYSLENVEKIPSVTVEVKVLTEDLFRVPFINVTSLERRAQYELPEKEKAKNYFEKSGS